jgi:fibronectin type 3 domain-containing protein
MKKLILVLFIVLLVSTPALSGKSITLIWDANTEPDLMGYRIYQSRVQGKYTFGKYSQNFIGEVYCFPNDPTCCEFTISPGPSDYYVVTAIDIDGFESEPSNEVNP